MSDENLVQCALCGAELPSLIAREDKDHGWVCRSCDGDLTRKYNRAWINLEEPEPEIELSEELLDALLEDGLPIPDFPYPGDDYL